MAAIFVLLTSSILFKSLFAVCVRLTCLFSKRLRIGDDFSIGREKLDTSTIEKRIEKYRSMCDRVHIISLSLLRLMYMHILFIFFFISLLWTNKIRRYLLYLLSIKGKSAFDLIFSFSLR